MSSYSVSRRSSTSGYIRAGRCYSYRLPRGAPLIGAILTRRRRSSRLQLVFIVGIVPLSKPSLSSLFSSSVELVGLASS